MKVQRKHESYLEPYRRHAEDCSAAITIRQNLTHPTAISPTGERMR